MLVDTARRFVVEELYPFEQQVEQSDELPAELRRQIIERALRAGLYAANMPAELGGGGLDTLSMCILDRELGRANMALQYTVARPSNILQACVGAQREKYLYPCIRGEKTDCLAMTEPAPARTFARWLARPSVTVATVVATFASPASSISSATPMSPTSLFCSPPPAWNNRRAGRAKNHRVLGRQRRARLQRPPWL